MSDLCPAAFAQLAAGQREIGRQYARTLILQSPDLRITFEVGDAIERVFTKVARMSTRHAGIKLSSDDLEEIARLATTACVIHFKELGRQPIGRA